MSARKLIATPKVLAALFLLSALGNVGQSLVIVSLQKSLFGSFDRADVISVVRAVRRQCMRAPLLGNFLA